MFAVEGGFAVVVGSAVELQPGEQAKGDGSPEKADIGEFGHRDVPGAPAQRFQGDDLVDFGFVESKDLVFDANDDQILVFFDQGTFDQATVSQIDPSVCSGDGRGFGQGQVGLNDKAKAGD